MKKTDEDLLEFFGLKVGDKIKVDGYYYPFVIFVKDGEIFAKRENCLSSWDYYNTAILTDVLLNCEYEIITPKKKLGEMKCEEMLCKNCPLRAVNCDIDSSTLYEVLETYEKDLNSFSTLKPFEKALFDAIKAELDKEVEECEK